LGRKRSKSKANRSKVAVCFDSGQIGVAEIKYSQTEGPALQLSVSVPLNSTENREDALAQLVRQHQLQNKNCVNVLPSDSYQLIQADIGDYPQVKNVKLLGGKFERELIIHQKKLSSMYLKFNHSVEIESR